MQSENDNGVRGQRKECMVPLKTYFPVVFFPSSFLSVDNLLCGFCGSALSSQAHVAATLHLTVCTAPSAAHVAGLRIPRLGPVGCTILYQAGGEQTQVVVPPVPRADFTSNLLQL